jgi:HEPN domain-containing protein
MSERPEIADLASQWMQKADNDLRTAEHTIQLSDDCPFDTVCFHAQQCVEKYLKAVLVLVQTAFHNTHDLEELLLMTAPCVTIPVTAEELARLTPHATSTRYPDDWRMPTRMEADWAVGVARRVRQAVRGWVSEKLA